MGDGPWQGTLYSIQFAGSLGTLVLVFMTGSGGSPCLLGCTSYSGLQCRQLQSLAGHVTLAGWGGTYLK
jgi:hypothetical protein